MRKALMFLLPMTLALPACGLFAGGKPIVTASNAGCSSLIPDSWRKRVEGAPIPVGSTVVGDWIVFGDAQTGKLDVQGDRTLAVIEIYEKCEARDRQAVKQAGKRIRPTRQGDSHDSRSQSII